MWYSRHNAHGYMQVPCVNLSARQPTFCSEHRIERVYCRGYSVYCIQYIMSAKIRVPRVAGHVQPHWFATINSTWTSLCVREERGETVAWHGPSAPGSRNDQRSRLNPLSTRIYDLKRIARSPSRWYSSVGLTIWVDYWLLTGKIECVRGLGINIVKWKGEK